VVAPIVLFLLFSEIPWTMALAGYTFLYLNLSDTVLERTFEVKQTLHGRYWGSDSISDLACVR